jgi:hypothetical protein
VPGDRILIEDISHAATCAAVLREHGLAVTLERGLSDRLRSVPR